MSRRTDSTNAPTKVAVAVAAGVLVVAASLAIDGAIPISVMAGLRRVPAALAVGLGTVLALTALLARPESRSPSPSMPAEALVRIVAWWIGASAVCLLLAVGSWTNVGVIYTFVAIGTAVRALSVATYLRRRPITFQVWMPFAAILGIFALLAAVGLFLNRRNVPPPIEAALAAFVAPAQAPAPVSREAPNLGGIGMAIVFSGDVDLAGLHASLFTYRTPDGNRVDVYRARYPFPRPLLAGDAEDPSGWSSGMELRHLRAGSDPWQFMVVATQEEDVDAVAQELTGGEIGP